MRLTTRVELPALQRLFDCDAAHPESLVIDAGTQAGAVWGNRPEEIALILAHDSVLRAELAATVPGAVLIARIRRLLVVSMLGAVAYAMFMGGGKSYCAGGISGAGGFIDGAGQPTTDAPMCIQLALGPSPLVYLAIALIVLLALGRVLRAGSESAALRTLDRAASGVLALVAVALVVSHVWFAVIPVADIDPRSFTIFSPFPLGSIEVTTAPMTGE